MLEVTVELFNAIIRAMSVFLNNFVRWDESKAISVFNVPLMIASILINFKNVLLPIFNYSLKKYHSIYCNIFVSRFLRRSEWRLNDYEQLESSLETSQTSTTVTKTATTSAQ